MSTHHPTDQFHSVSHLTIKCENQNGKKKSKNQEAVFCLFLLFSSTMSDSFSPHDKHNTNEVEEIPHFSLESQLNHPIESHNHHIDVLNPSHLEITNNYDPELPTITPRLENQFADHFLTQNVNPLFYPQILQQITEQVQNGQFQNEQIQNEQIQNEQVQNEQMVKSERVSPPQVPERQPSSSKKRKNGTETGKSKKTKKNSSSKEKPKINAFRQNSVNITSTAAERVEKQMAMIGIDQGKVEGKVEAKLEIENDEGLACQVEVENTGWFR